MSLLTRLLDQRYRASEWIVCVKCGREGHRSHQCKWIR